MSRGNISQLHSCYQFFSKKMYTFPFVIFVFIKPYVTLLHWYRKLHSFYKIFKNESPRYLFYVILSRNPYYITINHANIPLFKTDHNFFLNSFFPSTIIKYNNLDPNLRNSDTYGTFKNTILMFIFSKQCI